MRIRDVFIAAPVCSQALALALAPWTVSGCSTAPSAASAVTHDGGPPATSDAGADAMSDAPIAVGPPTIVITGDGARTAAPTGFGQNYWCWEPVWGDGVHLVQSQVRTMGLRMLRAGGHNNDTNKPMPFTNAEVDRFVAYARDVGAEPILQVPLLADTTGKRATPQVAADLVTYANVTKGYGIKYWEIGNEPDMYSDSGDLPAGYTADTFCADFAAFGDAMRAVDPTIAILGPELAWKFVAGNDWLSPFLDKCGTKVDIVSVHRYPHNAAESTIENAVNDADTFRATLRGLRSTLDSHGLSATPLAITEANFSYEGDPTLQTQAGALGSFYAGLWVADTMGVAREENVWSLDFWSLSEGWLNGFFAPNTTNPQPALHAFELLSNHFGPGVLHAQAVPAGISAYASRDDSAKKTAVLLINRTATAGEQVLAFANVPAAPPPQALALPAYSLTLIELVDGASASHMWVYSKEIADKKLPPQAQ